MPLQQTSGNVTADAYGGGAAAVPNYIESVFSTWLYAGNGSTQTITNGIDLAGKGGLVWIKDRTAANNNALFDTARGAGYRLISDLTNAQTFNSSYVSSFNGDGFSLGGTSSTTNNLGDNYASWTFRKQPKFFDVVTYTGNGTTQNIAHNLGSTPGFVIVKCSSNAGTNWMCWHTASAGNFFTLNSTGAATADTGGSVFGNNSSAVAPTSTVFTVGSSVMVNNSGWTYVAYVFAHNAGGFGLTGTDNVISCGSFTTNGSGGVTGNINLGYEAQWVMMKCTSTTSNWIMVDVMRGFSQTAFEELDANTSAAAVPVSGGAYLYPTATGFGVGNGTLNNSQNWIYIAIRRGPMKVPTDGTKVFNPTTTSSDTATTNFPVDLLIEQPRTAAGFGAYWVDRLRGGGNALVSASTAAESAGAFASTWSQSNTGVNNTAFGAGSSILWSMGRAPGFFDEVCFTDSGSAMTIPHNLTVAPEMIITKMRNATGDWLVGATLLSSNWTYGVYLNATLASDVIGNVFNSTAPTSSNFQWAYGLTGKTFVAYLFASCPGVSKVGSYTGNGSTQTINCGFTGGARFVLIKRTDSTGNWYVYDTARGMTTLTDPYLLMNSTAAETATLGSVTSVTTGFALNASILAAINTNAASYIYLAIS